MRNDGIRVITWLQCSLLPCMMVHMHTATNLIGSKRACEILEVDRATLVRMVRDGRLEPVSKMEGRNGAYVFDTAAVTRLAEARAIALPGPALADAEGDAR